jgi:translation initiation factor 3 subunit E
LWNTSLKELNSLQYVLDSHSPASFLASAFATANNLPDPTLGQLQSRTWLAHWSFFVYFNHPQGHTLLLVTFFSPTYLPQHHPNIRTFPQILRYLAVAVILSCKTVAGVGASAIVPLVLRASCDFGGS